MYCYVYFNRKVGAFQDPFFQPIEKTMFAKLSQRQVILNPDQAKATHTYECDLYYLGTYDEETAAFFLLDKPEFLCTYSNLEVKNDA